MMALGLFSPHMFVSNSHSSQKINFCWEHNVVMRQVILAGLFLYLLYKAADSLSINYHQLWGLPGVFPLELSAFWAHSQVCCLEKQRWRRGKEGCSRKRLKAHPSCRMAGNDYYCVEHYILLKYSTILLVSTLFFSPSPMKQNSKKILFN